MFSCRKHQNGINIFHVTFLQFVWIKPQLSSLRNIENWASNFLCRFAMKKKKEYLQLQCFLCYTHANAQSQLFMYCRNDWACFRVVSAGNFQFDKRSSLIALFFNLCWYFVREIHMCHLRVMSSINRFCKGYLRCMFQLHTTCGTQDSKRYASTQPTLAIIESKLRCRLRIPSQFQILKTWLPHQNKFPLT